MGNEWTIRRRVAAGMGVMCALVAFGTSTAVWNAHLTVVRTWQTQQLTDRDKLMAKLETGHMNWARDLTTALQGGGEFRGELDPKHCMLGQWLYSDAVQRQVADPEIRGKVAELEEHHRRMHGSAGEVLAAAKSGGTQAALAAFQSTTAPALKATGEALAGIREREQEAARRQTGELLERSKQAGIALGVMGAGGLLAACVIAFLLIRDLNAKLSRMVAELRGGAEQVLAAAEHVSAGSQTLAQGASKQAASIDRSAEGSRAVKKSADKSAGIARGALELVEQSTRQFDQAGLRLNEMVAAMRGIGSQSDKISKIIRTIDEIAFQTNILALNAAVEAARAGEAGMGFAVVAEQVRSLAQRCARAAQETSGLIEESMAKSRDGQVRVDEVAVAIHGVMAEVHKVSDLIRQLESDSREQTARVGQIVGALGLMEETTQVTAAGAEESASAAEQLNAQAATLTSVVRELTALAGG